MRTYRNYRPIRASRIRDVQIGMDEVVFWTEDGGVFQCGREIVVGWGFDIVGCWLVCEDGAPVHILPGNLFEQYFIAADEVGLDDAAFLLSGGYPHERQEGARA